MYNIIILFALFRLYPIINITQPYVFLMLFFWPSGFWLFGFGFYFIVLLAFCPLILDLCLFGVNFLAFRVLALWVLVLCHCAFGFSAIWLYVFLVLFFGLSGFGLLGFGLMSNTPFKCSFMYLFTFF